jgi:hypothetical protein
MNIKEASKYSIRNMEQLLKSKIAGCYCCCEIYDVSEITEWTDGGITALCPQCSVDSVLGDNSPYSIDRNTLTNLKNYWF